MCVMPCTSATQSLLELTLNAKSYAVLMGIEIMRDCVEGEAFDRYRGKVWLHSGWPATPILVGHSPPYWKVCMSFLTHGIGGRPAIGKKPHRSTLSGFATKLSKMELQR